MGLRIRDIKKDVRDYADRLKALTLHAKDDSEDPNIDKCIDNLYGGLFNYHCILKEIESESRKRFGEMTLYAEFLVDARYALQDAMDNLCGCTPFLAAWDMDSLEMAYQHLMKIVDWKPLEV